MSKKDGDEFDTIADGAAGCGTLILIILGLCIFDAYTGSTLKEYFRDLFAIKP